jgi:phosphoribosylformylglycinamidine synthase
VLSCHDISQGGLFAAAAEMAFGGDTGLLVDTTELGSGDIRAKLFSEGPTRWLIEVAPQNVKKIESTFGQYAKLLGTTGSSKVTVMEKGNIEYTEEVEYLRKLWETPIWDRMGSS